MGLLDNLESTKTEIREAAERSGRSLDEVRLAVVSKTWPAEVVAKLTSHHGLFAENKVQEAIEKIPLLPSRLEWHLIGHLQSNKVRRALPLFALIQSVDSLDLAEDINRIGAELGLFPKVFLQVNVAGEARKHGFSPEALRDAFPRLLALPRLEIQGLMTIPPYEEEPEASRGHFRALRLFRDEMRESFGISLDELSMGMSHDFTVAIEEGATMVRVGSAIFGDRKAAHA